MLAQEMERLKENSSTRVPSHLGTGDTEQEEYSVEERNTESNEEAGIELRPLGLTEDVNTDNSKAGKLTDVVSLPAEADNENDNWEITSRRRGSYNKHFSRKAREDKQAKGSQDTSSMELSTKNAISTKRITASKPVRNVEEKIAHGHSQMTRMTESTASSDSSVSTEYPASKISRGPDSQTSMRSNGEQIKGTDSVTYLQSEKQGQRAKIADSAREEMGHQPYQSNGAETVDNGYHVVNSISSNSGNLSSPLNPESKNGYSSNGSDSKSSDNLAGEHHVAVFVTPPSSKANPTVSSYQEQNSAGVPISFMTSSIIDWPLQMASTAKSSTESIVYVTPMQHKSTAFYAPSGVVYEKPVFRYNGPTVMNEDTRLGGVQNTVHGGKQ